MAAPSLSGDRLKANSCDSGGMNSTSRNAPIIDSTIAARIGFIGRADTASTVTVTMNSAMVASTRASSTFSSCRAA